MVDGLDLDQLRGIRTLQQDQQTSVRGGITAVQARIRDHLNDYDGYLAWSGGKDSTAVVHLARTVEPNIPVVWFDSGLEFPETHHYIREVAAEWDLNLTVIEAQPTAVDILEASGFWDHHATAGQIPDLHDALIGRPAAQAHADYGPGELLGLRSSESADRRRNFAFALRREIADGCNGCCRAVGTAGRPSAEQRARHGGLVRRKNGTIAYSPIWNWTVDRVRGYLAAHNVPLNPLYERLARLGIPEEHRRVGLMLDANGLEFGRATWLKRGWPDIFRTLVDRLPRLAEWT